MTIGGIMGGAMVSGRLAGKVSPKKQIRQGFPDHDGHRCHQPGVANLLFTAHVGWALFPLGIFSFGWALMVPVVTLLVLDLHPERRGMASSLQMFVGIHCQRHRGRGHLTAGDALHRGAGNRLGD